MLTMHYTHACPLGAREVALTLGGSCAVVNEKGKQRVVSLSVLSSVFSCGHEASLSLSFLYV